MLRFGIVSQINPVLAQARVNFADDESTSYWLPIIQSKTMKDKFFVMPDIGEEVACLMDENSEDGVILGAIYSSVDLPAVTSEKQISVNLENSSLINIDKETNTFVMKSEKVVVVANFSLLLKSIKTSYI